MKNHSILFTKMHGLGNDFILLNALQHPIAIDALPIQSLANRHLGIGFDQLLLIEPSTKADIACRIFNQDGSEAEQCGNGMRCVARFVYDEKIIPQKNLTIETKAGIIETMIQDESAVQVNMGIPHLQKDPVYFENQEIISLSMGNPHAILMVPQVATTAVQQLGPFIGNLKAFPQGANVGFVEIVHSQHIRLRTFERGAGETYACGSNACAAVVAGISKKQLRSPVIVELTFGQLTIQWAGEKTSYVIMSGPATRVFAGQISLA